MRSCTFLKTAYHYRLKAALFYITHGEQNKMTENELLDHLIQEVIRRASYERSCRDALSAMEDAKRVFEQTRADLTVCQESLIAAQIEGDEVLSKLNDSDSEAEDLGNHLSDLVVATAALIRVLRDKRRDKRSALLPTTLYKVIQAHKQAKIVISEYGYE